MKRICVGLAAIVMAFAVLASSARADTQESKRMKPALLVIDVQNEYMPWMAEEDVRIGTPRINAAMRVFRAHGFPVIRVYHTDPKYGPEPGSKGFEFADSIVIDPGDLKIVKNFPNAFKKTGLEDMLQEKGINTVYLCGLSAVGCVLATYYGALDLDYKAFMLKDHLISHNSAYTDQIEDIFDALGSTALMVMLANAEH